MIDLRELLARAMCGEDMECTVVSRADDPEEFDASVEAFWTSWEHQADAILAALDAAGLVVVPREPTPEMWAASGTAVIKTGPRHHDIVSEAVYQAMLAASPYAKNEVE